MFMNTHEIASAALSTDPTTRPNYSRAADTLANLAQWADENSDGWAYWPKPSRAAASLQRLVSTYQYRDADCTEADLVRVYAPVKAFLTRQGVSRQDALDIVN